MLQVQVLNLLNLK